MAYSHIASQDTLNTASAASVTTTYGATATAGNLLIATCFSTGVAVGSNTISGWTVAATITFLSAVDETTIFYKIATGTETGITATCSGATSMVLAVHEFATGNLTGIGTITDQSNTNNTGLGTSAQTGSITPTKTNELIITAMGFPTGGTSVWSWDSGLSVMSSNVNLLDGFLVDQNVAAINPTASWTGSSTAGGAIASFFQGSTGDSGSNYSALRHIQVGNGMGTSGEAN